jgi:hypothetical protein
MLKKGISMSIRSRVVIFFVIIFAVLAVVKMSGVRVKANASPLVARVNGYEIRADEFEEGFLSSGFVSREDRLKARREYLDVLIGQKLILLDAQKRNVDKTPEFLRSVERFWSQSLLTAAVGQKAVELRRGINVRDEDVHRIYEDMLKEGVTTRPLSDVYSQIKWQAERQQESAFLAEWVKSLRQSAALSIDEQVLKALK